MAPFYFLQRILFGMNEELLLNAIYYFAMVRAQSSSLDPEDLSDVRVAAAQRESDAMADILKIIATEVRKARSEGRIEGAMAAIEIYDEWTDATENERRLDELIRGYQSELEKKEEDKQEGASLDA